MGLLSYSQGEQEAVGRVYGYVRYYDTFYGDGSIDIVIGYGGVYSVVRIPRVHFFAT